MAVATEPKADRGKDIRGHVPSTGGVMWRTATVCDKFGVVPSTIFDWAKRGIFVPGVKIGPRAVAFPSDEVDAIRDARVAGASEAEIRTLVSNLIARRVAARPMRLVAEPA